MAETGFADCKNIKLEFRWADGQLGRRLEMATDLAQRQTGGHFAGAIDVRIKALKDAIASAAARWRRRAAAVSMSSTWPRPNG